MQAGLIVVYPARFCPELQDLQKKCTFSTFAFHPLPPRPAMQHGANVPSQALGIPQAVNTTTVPENTDSRPVTSWDSLCFGPIGVYNLRRWQIEGVFPGIRDFFITCQSRFRSADIAWFASGMNRDGNHLHRPSSFHPSLVRLYKDTSSTQAIAERKALLAEVKEQMFDTVCSFNSLHLVSTDHLFTRQQCTIASPAVQQW